MNFEPSERGYRVCHLCHSYFGHLLIRAALNVSVLAWSVRWINCTIIDDYEIYITYFFLVKNTYLRIEAFSGAVCYLLLMRYVELLNTIEVLKIMGGGLGDMVHDNRRVGDIFLSLSYVR